ASIAAARRRSEKREPIACPKHADIPLPRLAAWASPPIHEARTLRLGSSGAYHANNVGETKCHASETPFRRYRRACGRTNTARSMVSKSDPGSLLLQRDSDTTRMIAILERHAGGPFWRPCSCRLALPLPASAIFAAVHESGFGTSRT